MFQNDFDAPFQRMGRFGLLLVALLWAFEHHINLTHADEGKSANRKLTAKSPAKKDVEVEESVLAVDLLAGELHHHWKHFCSKDAVALTDVWEISQLGDEQILICRGDPKGFLFTQKTYADFELAFEWKYVNDQDGNSGVLLFTQNEPRLWPTSMQIQLHQPNAGAVFPSGDAKSDNSTDPTGPPLARDVGKWNTCRISASAGRIHVHINGRIAGEVSGCHPNAGRIALQSEGSETHFRRIRIKDVSPITSTPRKAKPSKLSSDATQG